VAGGFTKSGQGIKLKNFSGFEYCLNTMRLFKGHEHIGDGNDDGHGDTSRPPMPTRPGIA